MRLSKTLLPTLKEAPAEAEIPSHILMVRGGYLRKVAAGVYSFLPIGLRVIQKIEKIIREEMTLAGASEVLLPAVIPGELWKESGRWDAYGAQLLRFTDRKEAPFVIGPTHEESIVDLVRDDVKSYRQLPLNLFQIQTKFRDELRPRAGLMRGREFVMKDAYSFHVDEADAMREYRNMYAAYERIFARCGLNFRAVEADTGAIGGSTSHEFQVLAETGEDVIVACDSCEFAANVEEAPLEAPAQSSATTPASTDLPAAKEVETPGVSTIDEVAKFLGTAPNALAKTLIYKAVMPAGPVKADPPTQKFVAVLVRGDRTVNEIKVRKAVGASELVLASDAEVASKVGGVVGFVGPVGLRADIYCDAEVAAMEEMVVGANVAGKHLKHVVMGRDFSPTVVGDYRQAEAGDPCPRCEGGRLRMYRGIEVGQVFFLGTKYTEAMKGRFLDKDGKEKNMVMGCYGIGVTRVAAAAVEQNHDDNGICWPVPIAPYEVHLIALQAKDPDVMLAAENLYKNLSAAGIEVLFDDRDGRPGGKFKDADLIGLPYRVAVGKKGLAEGQVEVKQRVSDDVKKLSPEDAAVYLTQEIANARSPARSLGGIRANG